MTSLLGLDRIRLSRQSWQGEQSHVAFPAVYPDFEQYSELKWTHEHFTGMVYDHSYIRCADGTPSSGIDWDHRTRKNEIFRIVSDKHKGWSQHVDKEFGNYDYLLGIDVRMK